MVAIPRELAIIIGALAVQFIYRLVYEHWTPASASTVPQAEEAVKLQSAQPTAPGSSSSRSKEEKYVAPWAKYVDWILDYGSGAWENAPKDARNYGSWILGHFTGDQPSASKQKAEENAPTPAPKYGDLAHLEFYSSEPQASVENWGSLYERHLACNISRQTTAIWTARIRQYGEDPVGGDSFGVSITGAQMLSIDNGRELLLHGGWDDRTSSRSAVFSIDINEVVHSGRLVPAEIPIAFARGVNADSCPGPAYGHSVTALGGHEFLVVGGQARGGYRMTLDHWGVFRLTRSAGSSPWRLQWLRCGRSKEAKRAWHSATFVPSIDSSQSYVFLCGGTDVLAPGATFEPQSGRFKALSDDVGKYCKRAGHSAVLTGGHVIVMGGTNYLGPGMPWNGDDLQHLMFFNTITHTWHQTMLKYHGADGVFARQHSSAMIAEGFAVAVGGGFGGADSITLLNLTTLPEHLDKSHWTRRVPLSPLPASCPGEEPEARDNVAVPSAHVPALRGQSMVWTGQELVMFGGAVAEQPGYHGMLLLRPLWDPSLVEDEEDPRGFAAANGR